jgi:hypothetical protein
MRIVTARTFFARVVLIRVKAFDFGPFTCGIAKIGMAPETEFAGPVYKEFGRFCRMLKSRSMAVFAFYDFMGGRKDLALLLGMTVLTIFFPLIFYFDGLPLLYIPRPVPAIHVPSFMDAEIFGHDEGPGD